MKNIILLSLLILLGAVAPVGATPLVGAELAKFSVLAGGYASYGANASFSDEVGAVSYIAGEERGGRAGNRINTVGVTGALGELATAQKTLNQMVIGTALGTTMIGKLSLDPGVYGASALTTAAGTILTLDGHDADNPFWIFNIGTYLSTGAGTTIELINAGKNASVVWNTGGYLSMGASTSFLGTVMSGAYISQGAGSLFQCGNLFAASYISIGAGSNLTSTHCLGNATWAGSEFGLGSGLDIVDGVVQARLAPSAQESAAAQVSEPGTMPTLLLGLGLMGMLGKSRKAVLRRTANS